MGRGHPRGGDAVHTSTVDGPVGRSACWLRTGARRSRRCSAVPLLLVAVAVALVALAVPSGASARETVPLSSHWKFHLGDVAGAEAPAFDDRSWRTLDLPHTWNALDAQNGSPAFPPDYFRGVGWDRKTVTVPARLRGQRLFLQFGGAASVADVYVNGVHVGHNENPFMRFRVDVTEALGDGGTIAAKVDNSARPYIAPLFGDFPLFGGLYRAVALLAVNATHLD